MQNSSILLISDIHYTDNKDVSQFSNNNTNDFYQTWLNYLLNIEKKQNTKIKYIIIAGDIVEEAKKNEYIEIADILNRLITELKIEKQNVLIIPGNHDINRHRLAEYCDENDIIDAKASEQFDIKLSRYIKFYEEFFGKKLDVTKAVLSTITIDEINVIITGINSLVKESHLEKDHVGYVNAENLKTELQSILENEKKTIYIVTHHSFKETGRRELATISNASVIEGILDLLGINTYIYGHHHTSESKLDIKGDEGQIHRYIEIGSLGKIFSDSSGSFVNRFSVAICKSNEIELHDYAYMNLEWDEVNSNKYIHKLPIKQVLYSETEINEHELPEVTNEEINNEPKGFSKDIIICENSKFIFDVLKNELNYKEGHFHWENGEKTLGWINIASFLGNENVLFKIKQCIMEMHKQFFESVQVVLGYGLEGNIIGSYLLDYWIENKKIYHSYPSVHKKDEHIKIEKKLWNEYGTYKSVLLICDIMPPNSYLKEIIESSEELKKCTEYYILSLFCNRNLLKSDANIEFSKDIAIQKLSIAEVNIPVCNLDEKECIICSKGLKKIYTL